MYTWALQFSLQFVVVLCVVTEMHFVSSKERSKFRSRVGRQPISLSLSLSLWWATKAVPFANRLCTEGQEQKVYRCRITLITQDICKYRYRSLSRYSQRCRRTESC